MISKSKYGFVLGALAAGALAAPGAWAEPYYLIAAGLGGQPDYEKQFEADAQSLAAAARRTVGDESRVKVLTGSALSHESLEAAFAEMAQKVNPTDTVMVFLIGHGSYDGSEYKFNIPGPDVDGAELLKWLSAVPARSQLVVDTTSASGAVLKKWAADGRTVITATRSGAERNATRFGVQWAAALSSKEADTNKDEVITAQEAFNYASRKVADSYKSEGTLATEHPQLEGEAAANFTVARLTAPGKRSPEVAQLYSQLGDLEGRIEALRQRRNTMQQAEYLDKLQGLLVQLATVQQKVDKAEGRGDASAGKTEEPTESGGDTDEPTGQTRGGGQNIVPESGNGDGNAEPQTPLDSTIPGDEPAGEAGGQTGPPAGGSNRSPEPDGGSAPF